MLWSEVQETWKRQYQAYGEDPLALITHLFQPKVFFTAGSKTSGMPLCTERENNHPQLKTYYHIGRYAATDEMVILVHSTIVEQLRGLLRGLVISYGFPEPDFIAVTPQPYTDINECYINDHKDYTALLNTLKKTNKANVRSQHGRHELDLAIRLVQQKQYVFISLDIEAYEKDHSILLEIGWSMYDSKNDMFLDQHYMINDYRHLTNGTYVDDQKLKFQFGSSVWCGLKQAFEELRKDIDWAIERDGGFALIGHGLASDLKYLEQQKFKWPSKVRKEIKDRKSGSAIKILNTDTMYGVYINQQHNPPSLRNTLEFMDIESWCLHNAGNDAHYTMELFMKIVEKASKQTDRLI
ncbi:hypothetical protein BDF14DRAFT_1880347 [Spinellus fusiger]|nr:hypothetical protein BDF14DRAFT_1880347 [Spinellus fusiger]